LTDQDSSECSRIEEVIVLLEATTIREEGEVKEEGILYIVDFATSPPRREK
jgi:hypothetical protein